MKLICFWGKFNFCFWHQVKRQPQFNGGGEFRALPNLDGPSVIVMANASHQHPSEETSNLDMKKG
jgi:hypothetical protein